MQFGEITWKMRSGKCYGVTDNLPTDYQHIADCRSSVGRLLVDSCLVLQPKSVDRQTANSRPTDGRQSVVCRPTNDQQTVNSRPTDDRQLADRRPTGFFGELFFTFTQTCINASQMRSLVGNETHDRILRGKKFFLLTSFASCGLV